MVNYSEDDCAIHIVFTIQYLDLINLFLGNDSAIISWKYFICIYYYIEVIIEQLSFTWLSCCCSDEKENRFTASQSALATIMRSWPGKTASR